MGEFNGKKFYGFSLQNDPALTTTTRNFEFRYTRPETLERAIQKVQLTDGTKDKQRKNLLLNKYCKPKGLRRSDGIPVKSLDADVETQLSRKEDPPPVPEGAYPVRPTIRKLSDNEIEKLIGKAKSTMEMISDQSRGDHPLRQMRSTTTETEEEEDVPSPPMSEQTTQTLENALLEIFCHPQPQWVEIVENSQTSGLLVSEVKEKVQQQPNQFFGDDDLKAPNLFHHFSQMQSQYHHQRQLPKQSKSQPAYGTRYSDKTSSNRNSYYIEDSDYEYEMMGRSAYTKFCGPRPQEDDMTNVSNEDGGVAEFVEMEPRIPCMDLSFLKNSSPIRYTDFTDELHEEETHNEASQMKVFIKNLKAPNINETVNETKPVEKKVTEKKPLPKEITSVSQHKVFNPKVSKKQNKRVASSSVEIPLMRSLSPRKYMDTALLTPRSARTSRSPRSARNTPRKRMNSPRSPRDNTLNPSRIKVKNIILTKSIEELKIEKIGLFTKMTATQERIIELLDKLRLNLLEIYIPDSSFDKSKRQKNAFEFSVRFSRNFLYPLKGMIDDMRTIPKEHFNSSASNDACARIGAIYALIQQSLTTYQKQLRFFLLDQVPQKLTTLIDMINTLTHICLDKHIFDRQDPIIECLLDRCSKFMGFLEDMHEERFMTARDNYCKANLEKKPTTSVHTKYDLKMFMNDLNMYEPKLVPKSSRHPLYKLYQKQMNAGNSGSPSPKKHRRSTKAKKSVQEANIDNNSSTIGFIGAEVSVPTQIQGVDGSSELLSSVQNLLSSSNDKLCDKARTQEVTNTLNNAVIEALQLVTKEQVRRVLEPIIQTLGTALDKKNNSETIEAILKALNKKSFPTKQNENIKRHDTEKIERRSKVSNKKVAPTNSTSSIQNSTNALKATKQTKNRSTSKKRESSKTVTAAADDDDGSAAGTSAGTAAAAAGARGGIEVDSATASETESEFESVVPEIESVNDNNFELSKFDVQISRKKRIEVLQQQEHRLMRRREQMLRQEQYHKHLQYQQQQHQKQQQHIEQHIQNQLEEQEAHEQQQSQQLHRSNQNDNQTSTGQKGTAPTTNQYQQQEAAAPTPTVISDTTTHRETTKPRPVPPSNRYKARFFKKKRNPMLSPPPAPSATPLTSARSPRSSRFSYMARQTGVEVEELPHTAAASQQRVTHTDGSDDDGDNSKAKAANNNNMTSHRDATEALEALTAAINKQRSTGTEAVAAAAAIAAALGSANFTDNEEALNLLQSSVIVDVLAKCIANTKLNEQVTDDEDEEDDEVEQTRDKRVTNTSADAGNASDGEGDDRSSHGAGGDHYGDMYSNNPALCNQQMVHMQQLQKQQQQQLQFQRNQLVQQIRELQNIPMGQPAAQQQNETKQQQQQRQDLFGKLAEIEKQSHEQQYSSTTQKSPRRPLNEINQYLLNCGNSYNNFDNDKENSRPMLQKSSRSKSDLKIDSLLHERDQFLGLCSKNRFYANPNYSEPWKVFSRISDKLATEIVNSVEEDFTIGVSKFVQDFLELETQT